jgi:hypothetical protein
MTFDELVDRLKDRFFSYWRSEKRSVKFISRLLAFALFGAIISTIAPTLADELSTDPGMLEPVVQNVETTTTTIITPETPTAAPSTAPSASSEPVVSRPPVATSSPAPLPESSDSATIDAAGEPLAIQPKYIVRVPQSGAIDPRAMNYFLPHIFASQDDPEVEFTMICVRGSAGMRFDAMQKGVPNNMNEGNTNEGSERLYGDQSGFLVISAETNRAINLLNSYQGLFISSLNGGLSGRSLSLDFIAVTKPVADPAFCGAAKSGATMTLRPLGLDLSTVKGGGKLK